METGRPGQKGLPDLPLRTLTPFLPFCVVRGPRAAEWSRPAPPERTLREVRRFGLHHRRPGTGAAPAPDRPHL